MTQSNLSARLAIMHEQLLGLVANMEPTLAVTNNDDDATALRDLAHALKTAGFDAAALETQIATPRRVVVGVEGGLVQGASADGPCDIVVLDYDANDDEACLVPQVDGDDTEAWVFEHGADDSAPARAWVHAIHTDEHPRITETEG